MRPNCFFDRIEEVDKDERRWLDEVSDQYPMKEAYNYILNGFWGDEFQFSKRV